MIHAKPYDTYFGGKSGNGTIHTIINHIPPHKAYYSLFAGNDAVFYNKKPAAFNLLNDLDIEVVNAWKALKLPNLELTCCDALDVLKELAANGNAKAATPVIIPVSDTFIFLDPPYVLETIKSPVPVYKYTMTEQQHVDLLSQITSMSDFKIMICCYPNELYGWWLAGWDYHDYYSMIRGGMALERIYYNYELTGELHDYRCLGMGFREREAYNRIKKNMIKKLSTMPVELRNSVLSDIETYFLNDGK